MAEAKLEVAEALEREEAFRVLTEYSVAHPRTLAGLSRACRVPCSMIRVRPLRSRSSWTRPPGNG